MVTKRARNSRSLLSPPRVRVAGDFIAKRPHSTPYFPPHTTQAGHQVIRRQKRTVSFFSPRLDSPAHRSAISIAVAAVIATRHAKLALRANRDLSMCSLTACRSEGRLRYVVYLDDKPRCNKLRMRRWERREGRNEDR